jgi:POT family proton-dependent oligopeptide transporter
MIPYKRISTSSLNSDSAADESDDDNDETRFSESEDVRSPANEIQTQSLGIFAQMKNSFLSLRGAPRELYINFFLKFCESYGYFALSQILVIYLHQEFGVSDMQAGAVYGLWGAAITFWGFVTACFNDKLGVRFSLLIGFFISGLSALILAFARSKLAVYITLFGILPIGNSIGIPMLTVGIKRYTTSQNRGFAFGLFYAVMNIAALASGPIVDFFNIIVTPNNSSRAFSGNRMVILSVVINYLISWSVTFFFLREININDNDKSRRVGLRIVQTDLMSPTAAASTSSKKYKLVSNDCSIHVLDSDQTIDSEIGEQHPKSQTEFSPLHIDMEDDVGSDQMEVGSNKETSNASTSQIVYELLISATFWRFVVLTLFLINLRTIFRHVDATLPTYLIRTFGENYPKGMIYAINPFLIIWLTPTVAALTTTWPHFDMIKYGSYVSAISPFFLVVSTSTWSVVSFMVLLSFGEAIWSPRLYDYTMSIAPEVSILLNCFLCLFSQLFFKGKEATFSSLAAAPLFAAKIPVGLLSGYLISTYLPEDKTEKPNGPMLWLIIGLLTV